MTKLLGEKIWNRIKTPLKSLFRHFSNEYDVKIVCYSNHGVLILH